MNKKRLGMFPVALLLVIVGAAPAFSQVIYDNIPNPLPGNLSSWGFEATGTSEFGDRVAFAAATPRNLSTVTVTMSSWGCQSGSATGGDCVSASGATFSHPITLNIYNVGPLNTVGSLIGSVTQTFAIPYRPSADFVNCTGGRWFDGTACFNGFANNITFNLSGLTVPDQVIFGVAYNTTHYGYTPIVAAPCNSSPGGCGYDSLNVAVANPAVSNTVGSNPAPSDAYQYTIYSSCLDGPIIPFGLDAGCWAGFKPAIRFNASNVALTKDDCKNGGWQTHTTASGEPFRNQGQCVSYVNHQ
jgi:hypothetical protein